MQAFFVVMNNLILIPLRQAKRVIVAVVGFTILLIGLAMIVLPGPAFIVIPIGLTILATEFVWARRLLKSVRSRLQKKNSNPKSVTPAH